MKFINKFFLGFVLINFSSCTIYGDNPEDPFEPINRKTYAVNNLIDKNFLKPTAKVYKAVIPSFIRKGINNVYNNIAMLPTIANDLFQTDFNYAIKDTWRFFFNSTIGIGGFFDVAASSFKLPPHNNDLGITFAKWGDTKSPYVVIPLLGPSTIRDGMGMLFDYSLFTPYFWIPNDDAAYSILAVRYVDLRSQLLEMDKYVDESFDQYAFVRDAYLQHRNYLINGEPQEDTGSLYIGEE